MEANDAPSTGWPEPAAVATALRALPALELSSGPLLAALYVLLSDSAGRFTHCNGRLSSSMGLRLGPEPRLLCLASTAAVLTPPKSSSRLPGSGQMLPRGRRAWAGGLAYGERLAAGRRVASFSWLLLAEFDALAIRFCCAVLWLASSSQRTPNSPSCPPSPLPVGASGGAAAAG